MPVTISAPSSDTPALEHEQIVLRRGERSGLPLLIAVHSTRLGPALGGCRVWQYPSWREGLEDVLRLSSAMTLKCAAADLPTGGGKSVIALQPGQRLEGEQRRAAFRDLGEAVDALGGAYRTAEDVGTSTADMHIVRERTRHVFGLPTEHGGIGEPAAPTALGVYAALRSALKRINGSHRVEGLRITVSGLGQVGTRLTQRLAEEGAVLTVTDVDATRAIVGAELGARWVSPEQAWTIPADVVIPAGVGGALTTDVIRGLDCRAVVGPANNQLAHDSGADLMAERNILWAPDFVANAGGAIFAILADDQRLDPVRVLQRVEGIESTLDAVFDRAAATGTTPLQAARTLAHERLDLTPHGTD
ncbi:Glu/Leu/Phe/Val dehydrogenase [Streptomyces sp. NBC_00829]|uniref:Glu/Leu/Phe/Val family dehydrogenase n=1 Tax=Streptomyces sp. NBC_00829 TaxID=2903679 RepID=UPI00386D0CC1|nr:Glu/Leu/Phe/Val dehydrogenase [Streptomyces sp. NBC_00829]